MPRKKKEDDVKLFDVAKPGKSAPSASSKPIIITNRPLLQDPMVVGDGTAAEAPSGTAAKPSEPKVTIKPLSINVTDGTEPKAGATKEVTSEPAETEEAEVKPVAEKIIQPPAEITAESETEKPVEAKEETPAEPQTDQEASTEETPAEAPEAEEKAEPAKDVPKEETAEAESADTEESGEAQKEGDEDVPEQAKVDPDAAAKEAERIAAEHAAEIQKLADSHEYYLPIETTESKKTKRFVALGVVLILLLGAAWTDVALDAGLVQLGSIKPVTHFFKQPVASTPAASTPRVVSKTFTTPASGLSFRYPGDWQLNSTGTADRDTITLTPGTPSTSPQGDVSVMFLSLPVTSPPSSLAVNKVYYQKLAHKIHGDVYLRDLVYTDGTGKVNLTSSLGDDNKVKAGQTLQTDSQSFTGADGKSQNFFGITVVRVASGTANFKNVAEAQAYLHSSQYQQARTILLSTASQK